MGKYFGTDGFRGEANVQLTVDHAFKVGRYVGWYYGRDHKAKIVIGKDTRRSSYMFEYALVAGLTASGADVYLLHVTTTPSVSYAVRTEDFDCGIMISASHNPFYDNGIKLLNGNGQKIEAEIEERIEAYLDGEIEELPLAKKEEIGRTIDFASGRNRYIGYLISIPSRDFKKMRVGLDCSNGSSSAIAKSVFEALQAKTYVIHNEPDGTNINEGCGSTHIEELQRFVVEKGLDIGFAYDGDADRCIAVDHRGNVIDGDKILYICGKYLKEQNRECTLVYISPCISPIAELNEQINDVSYVISFDELDDWLAENQMCIEDEKENVEPRLSRMRALGGGMSRIMKKNPKYSYMNIEGIDNCIRVLNELKEVKEQKQAMILEAFNQAEKSYKEKLKKITLQMAMVDRNKKTY